MQRDTIARDLSSLQRQDICEGISIIFGNRFYHNSNHKTTFEKECRIFSEKSVENPGRTLQNAFFKPNNFQKVKGVPFDQK